LFASSCSSRRRGVVFASLIPCLWGKLQNLAFLKVVKQVLMSFCVAGVVLCHLPACLITCRKCQNWRKSRTKRSFSMGEAAKLRLFCCAHVAVSMGKAAKPPSFCCAHVAVSMGEAAKPCSFCCAHVAASMGEAAKPLSFCMFCCVHVAGSMGKAPKHRVRASFAGYGSVVLERVCAKL